MRAIIFLIFLFTYTLYVKAQVNKNPTTVLHKVVLLSNSKVFDLGEVMVGSTSKITVQHRDTDNYNNYVNVYDKDHEGVWVSGGRACTTQKGVQNVDIDIRINKTGATRRTIMLYYGKDTSAHTDIVVKYVGIALASSQREIMSDAECKLDTLTPDGHYPFLMDVYTDFDQKDSVKIEHLESKNTRIVFDKNKSGKRSDNRVEIAGYFNAAGFSGAIDEYFYPVLNSHKTRCHLTGFIKKVPTDSLPTMTGTRIRELKDMDDRNFRTQQYCSFNFINNSDYPLMINDVYCNTARNQKITWTNAIVRRGISWGASVYIIFEQDPSERSYDHKIIVETNTATPIETLTCKGNWVHIDTTSLPIITFDSTTITKPNIKQHDDTAGIFVFHFRNTGKSDLIITQVNSSCGCLVPYYEKEPIRPGKRGTVIGHYDTGRAGYFTKTLTVRSNATQQTVVLTIKGNVIAEK